MSDRVNILGCPVDRLGLEQTVRRCEELIERGGHSRQTSLNAAKLVSMRGDARLYAAVADSDLISADGQSIVWASRLLREPLPERVAGIDLMSRLLERSERAGYRVFVLGAREEILGRAVGRILLAHPRLSLAGAHHGWFSDDRGRSVAAMVRAAGADVLFVAMSSPRKEFWLEEYGASTGVAFAMGVGGALDVLAGVRRRAPTPLQRAGLEWAFRLVQEPRRLSGRYASTNARFAAAVIKEVVRR